MNISTVISAGFGVYLALLGHGITTGTFWIGLALFFGYGIAFRLGL